MTYRRLGVVLANLPARSAFGRSLRGDAAEWTLTDHLLATVVDLLAGGNWQRGGGKGKKPRPVQRPGVEDRNVKRYGSPMPLDELKRKLGKED